MKPVSLPLAVVVLVCLVSFPSQGLAQWWVPQPQLRGYEAQSHARWHAQRQMLYGPDGPVRATLHGAREVMDEVVHGAKRLTGDPDLQHYTRWDRRRLGVFGPYPGTAYYGGVGFGQPTYGYGQPVQQVPVFGGPALNQTGGARYPTRYNPSTRLYW